MLHGNDTDSSDAPNALKAWPRPPQVPQSLVTHRNSSLRSSLQQRCLLLVSSLTPAPSRTTHSFQFSAFLLGSLPHSFFSNPRSSHLVDFFYLNITTSNDDEAYFCALFPSRRPAAPFVGSGRSPRQQRTPITSQILSYFC